MLQGYSAQGRWPQIEILIDQNLVYKGVIEDIVNETFFLTVKPDQAQCTLEIKYINKSEIDTIVDLDGNIIENQHVEIKELIVNNIDIVKTQLIHKGIGQYQMHLHPEKLKYFLENNFSVKPSTMLDMYENGSWILNFELPVLSFLTQKQQNYVESWEQTNIDSLLNELYQQLLICTKLEEEKSHNA